MTEKEFVFFDQFRKDFKNKVSEWNKKAPELMELQKAALKAADGLSYSFETPIVYNTALDDISQEDEIKLLVIGDNPGKDEQLLKNNKYLVGQAGKIGEGFFRKNPELQIDFRKNVIILNKTPVHTAKTAQIKYLLKNGGQNVIDVINESQIWMAEKNAELCKNFNAEIWLIGYGELKANGIFSPYKTRLFDSCTRACVWDKVFVFQHFSMNRFSIDLSSFRENNPGLSLDEAIHLLGKKHKEDFFTDTKA